MSPFFFRLLAFLSIPSLSLAPPLSSFSSASRRRSGSFSILSLLFHPQLWHFSAHDYKPKQRSTTSTTALKYQDIRQPLVLPCTKRSFSRISACLDRSMMAFCNICMSNVCSLVSCPLPLHFQTAARPSVCLVFQSLFSWLSSCDASHIYLGCCYRRYHIPPWSVLIVDNPEPAWS